MTAICHDNRCIISGEIQSINETGCEIHSALEAVSPAFAQKATVLVSLLDEKSGRTLNLPARLLSARVHKGIWVYRVKWKGGGCPGLETML